MYSPRSDEWERLPWLADSPMKEVRRAEPLFPVGWLTSLMVVVAAGSFWAGSASVRAEQQMTLIAQGPAPAARSMSPDATEAMGVELLFAQRHGRANAPY